MSAAQTLDVLIRSTLWLSAALLLVILLRGPLMRRFGAASAYLSWLLVPLILMVTLLPASTPGQALQVIASGGGALPMLAAMPLNSSVMPSIIPAVLLGIWLLGVLAIALEMARRQYRFMAALQTTPDGTHWQSPAGSGPSLVGIWHPQVCLPVDFDTRFCGREQRLILAHEAVHRRRHDNAWNLLATTVCALQWFNPLAWLSLRLMRIDQELSCDAAVLQRHPAAAASYARALLAAQAPHSPANGLPWSSWRSAHPLVERVAMLKLHASARRKAGLRVLALLALVGAGAVHAIQSEPAADPAKQSARLVKIVMNLEVKDPGPDGKLNRSQPRMVVALGETASLETGSGAERVSLALTVHERSDGKLDIKTVIRRGTPWQLVASPRIVQPDGQRGRMELGDPGHRSLALDITASLLPPGTSARDAMKS